MAVTRAARGVAKRSQVLIVCVPILPPGQGGRVSGGEDGNDFFLVFRAGCVSVCGKWDRWV